jgi:hypothetical protein
MLTAKKPTTGLIFDGTNLRKEWMSACAACGLSRKIEVEPKKHDPRYEVSVLRSTASMAQ